MTRRAWLLIAGAYALLVIGGLVTLALIHGNANRIEAKADSLEQLTIDVTAAICLQAFASEPGERALVKAFVDGTPVPLDNETCQRAVAIARRQVDD